MTLVSNIPIFFSLLLGLHSSLTQAATFDIINQCTYTVWAAASPGGGRQLDQGQTWTIDVAAGTTMGRVWGRTGCTFDANGQGSCQTGDCNGLLECQGYGSPPNTLAEYALNQANNLDYIDISLVDGFNIPMDFDPTTDVCRGVNCTADINGQCPAELQAPGGCNNPCTVFQTNEYCCTNGPGTCGSTTYSQFFKERCPDAYSYPQDDQTSVFTCPSGTNYRVVFCPWAVDGAFWFDSDMWNKSSRWAVSLGGINNLSHYSKIEKTCAHLVLWKCSISVAFEHFMTCLVHLEVNIPFFLFPFNFGDINIQ